MAGFYGSERVRPEIRALYGKLLGCWCADTCAERMRDRWSEDDPTLGQCSITSFLVQDIYGGRVFGIPLPEGGFHCFNEVGGIVFDLTSEQFGEKAGRLDYTLRYEQKREDHFSDPDKLRRYLLLKKRFAGEK